MPSTTTETNRVLERARVSDCIAAGAEPLGKATAAPPGTLERLPDEIRDKLPDELVDELLVGPGGLVSQLTKRLVERAMEVELTDHLGYERHREPPGDSRNEEAAQKLSYLAMTNAVPQWTRTRRPRE